MDKAAAAKNRERRQRKKGSSKFVGVRIRKLGKYGAEITVPGNGRKWLGTFDTEEDAALAYDRAARSYGFAEIRCNFPNRKLPTPPPPESSDQGGESGEPENSGMLLPCQFNLNYPPPQF